MFLYLIAKPKNVLLNSTLENCLSIFCKNVKKKWYEHSMKYDHKDGLLY